MGCPMIRRMVLPVTIAILLGSLQVKADDSDEIKKLKQQIDKLEKENAELKKENKDLKAKAATKDKGGVLSDLLSEATVLNGDGKYNNGRTFDLTITIKERDGKKFTALYTWKGPKGDSGNFDIKGEIGTTSIKFETVGTANKATITGNVEPKENAIKCSFSHPNGDGGSMVIKLPKPEK